MKAGGNSFLNPNARLASLLPVSEATFKSVDPWLGYLPPPNRRRLLCLHIEEMGLQPQASALFKLPNLVCGRSEGLQSTHSDSVKC